MPCTAVGQLRFQDLGAEPGMELHGRTLASMYIFSVGKAEGREKRKEGRMMRQEKNVLEHPWGSTGPNLRKNRSLKSKRG